MSEVTILRFGTFELDIEAEQLRKDGRLIRLAPQPFKLLRLLVDAGGRVVTREEIRAALWTGDTFVDYEQGVNFAMRQVRDALGDDADRPLYVQTVPKRGYRFLAPIVTVNGRGETAGPTHTSELDKALWTNIVELRLADDERRRRMRLLAGAAVAALVLLVVSLIVMLYRA